MAVDLSKITGLTVQIAALQQQLPTITDPGAKALVGAQVAMLSAQLSAEAQHAQALADSSNNILNSLGIFSTLTGLVGGTAPSIIALFKK